MNTREHPAAARRLPRLASLWIAAAAAGALLLGCASLGLGRIIERPEARVVATVVESLSFEGVSLRFDVEITNPNPVGITLAGFDYDLAVEGTPFVAGRVDRTVGVAARGRSVVPVPVELAFENLYAAVRQVAEQDQFAYHLATGFSFDLPVLGRVRVPVSTAGTLPVVRVPRLRVSALRLDSLSLSGASLVLSLELENRNAFGMSLRGLEYSFAGNGQPWAAGAVERAVSLDPGGRGRVDLGFQISFAAVGRSAYQLLAVGGPLRYELLADLSLGTTLPLLPQASLPLRTEGELRVAR